MVAALRRPYCVPLSVMAGTPEQNNVKGSVQPNDEKKEENSHIFSCI